MAVMMLLEMVVVIAIDVRHLRRGQCMQLDAAILMRQVPRIACPATNKSRRA